MPKVITVANPLPKKNNIGKDYPRWHSKHPQNALVVPASVAPTIPRNQ